MWRDRLQLARPIFGFLLATSLIISLLDQLCGGESSPQLAETIILIAAISLGAVLVVSEKR